MSEMCFETLVENALCKCQFGVKYGLPFLDFDSQEKVLSFQISDALAKFCQNRLKIATVRARDTRTVDLGTQR